MFVCYKRIMRKWMSNRLRRRKKGAGEAAKEQPGDKAKTPQPLQPKYFDNDVSEEATASRERAAAVDDRHLDREPATEMEQGQSIRFEEQPSPAAQASGAEEPVASHARGRATSAGQRAGPSRRRKRRGRGGARRNEVSSPVGAPSAAVAEAPAEVAASVTPLPLDTGTPDTIAAELPPTTVVPAVPRPSKGTVVLAIGLPGSGKSSWFKRHNIRPLSSDLLRELLFDDAEEQRFQDLVFSNLRSMLKARLIARRPMSYVDATNLNPHERHGWIKLAKDYGYDVQGLFFDVPLEVCLERHVRRGRVVPEDIMRKMAGKLKPPTFEEGFSKITVVRVKKKSKS